MLQCLGQMWPFISDMVSKILKENVEPEIKKHMPSMLKSFHFVEVDLGSQVGRNHILFIFSSQIKERVKMYLVPGRGRNIFQEKKGKNTFF